MKFFNPELGAHYHKLLAIDKREKKWMVKHRRDAYLELAIAIGIGMLLGNPGNIISAILIGLAVGDGLVLAWLSYENRKTHKFLTQTVELDKQQRAQLQRYKR